MANDVKTRAANGEQQSSLTTAARGPDSLDRRAADNAQPNLIRYLVILLQLTLVLATVFIFRIERASFFVMMVVAVGGFAVHYWLPWRYKEPCFILLSMVGAYLLLGPLVATLVFATGFMLFGMTQLPLAPKLRIGLIAFFALAVIVVRHWGPPELTGRIAEYWPIVGAIFMFRMIIYLYDLQTSKRKPRLSEFGAYFFILPNFYFLLFPIIDFQTMRRSYFARPIDAVAQTGVHWITRGLVQLLVYRLLIDVQESPRLHPVDTLPKLVATMFATYLLYLHVSGTFHLIVGIMHLFGYDLPETNRRYLLASSFVDLWKRINIYWRDFMTKIVYMPVYFRLRRLGSERAQVIATICVFVATWVLHIYQYYWLSGQLQVTWTDSIFWSLLGVLVTLTVVWQLYVERRSLFKSAYWKLATTPPTLALFTVLWSFWNSPSVAAWIELVSLRSGL